MEPLKSLTEHRKRRRRRPWRIPISAKLTLDEHGKGDIGTISEDLYVDLFQHAQGKDSETAVRGINYIAITPWRRPSAATIDDCTWTILPVKVQVDRGATPSMIRFPVSSLSLQSFAAAVQESRNSIKPKAGFEILVLEVEPLTLDTICVKIDANALQKHDEVQKRFGGGFNPQSKSVHTGTGKGKAQLPTNGTSGYENEKLGSTQEDHLRAAIRSSLATPLIVHRDDLLPLPLPAHPITHVPFPPIQITFCEPCDQGLISGHTKIIIDIYSRNRSSTDHATISKRGNLLQHMIVEEDEDTSAEVFFSAAETGGVLTRRPQKGEEGVTIQSSTSDSSSEEDGSESDDLADNMISLNAPSLPLQLSGFMSSKTSTTPRPFGLQNEGVSTPGSVFSNYTATTARQGKPTPGRMFELRPLMSRVPEEVLHPPPSSDEDDEARIFVDIKVLVRLGCFSGDWIKLVCVPGLNNGEKDFLPSHAFRDDISIPEPFRVLKIYGLADASLESGPVYSRTSTDRRSSQSSVVPGSRIIASAYISPILFTNLGQPKDVIITPLSSESHNGTKFTRSKVTSSSIPPIAKEVTLLRVPTPLSTERAVQNGLLVNLKQYFEHRRRILRENDLIGIGMNVRISRILSETGPTAEPDHDMEELFLNSSEDVDSAKEKVEIAWFMVGNIQLSSTLEDKQTLGVETWGETASIEPMTTRMVQVGSHPGKVPSILQNPWQYYLGVKHCPKLTNSKSKDYLAKQIPGNHKHSPLRSRLRELLAAATSPQAYHLNMQPLVILLHSSQKNIGKTFLATNACADLGLHAFIIDAYDILTEGGAGSGDLKTEASFRARMERALTCGVQYTVPLIQHAEVLSADRMATALKDVVHDLRALIVTTTEIDKIPDSVRSLFTHELNISAPDESEREQILRGVIGDRGVKIAHDVELSAIAVKTAALVAGDLVDVVERALVARQERLEGLIANEINMQKANAFLTRDILVAGGTAVRCITKADFDIAVEAARKNFADSIGAPKIPNVSWDDVGGLSNVKDAVIETIQLPLERPELFAKGMKKRSGILFYGPPGTGKTLLAKAIATEFSLNFFSVKGPELLNMYIGESEANVRRVFQRARDARPCVVFFDELDSVAPKRGNQGDSGGVMDRIVSQLLAELDGMSDGDGGGGGVFVIGATNRPDLLDQALLRPGRFDKMLYLGISDTHDKQLTILEALTRKFTLHPQMSLRRVADSLPFTYTGADLYALCSDAMLKAITRQASGIDAKIKALPGGPVTTAYYFDHYATAEDTAVMVTEDDFFAAQRELAGSVRCVASIFRRDLR